MMVVNSMRSYFSCRVGGTHGLRRIAINIKSSHQVSGKRKRQAAGGYEAPQAGDACGNASNSQH
jgi:hypothetical protein